jgi:multiple sugar transport system substrate-binding protein
MRTRISLALIVLTVVAAGAAWASGSQETAAGKGKIVIDFQCNGGAVNQDMYQAWIKDFEAKNPDIQVNYMPFPEGGWAKVRATFAGGTAADVVRLNDDDVYDLGRLGKLVHLDPYIDKYLDRKDYFGATFQALNVGGKSYSANLAFGTNVFHYNTKLATNAGVRIPADWKSTWEWDQWVDTVRKLTQDKDGDGRPEVYGVGWEPPFYTPLLYSNGTNPLPAGITRADFVQPKLIEIYQAIQDVSAKHHYATPAEEDQNRTLLFNSEKLAMTWTTESTVPQFKPEIQWDIAPMPKAKEKAYSVAFVRSFGIPVWSKNADAAFRFYQYTWSDAGQKIMLDFGFGVPARRSAAENVFNKMPAPKHRAIYADQLDYDVPLPKDPLGAVWKKFATHELGYELMNGRKNAQEFLQFIQAEMEKRIEELKRGG